MKTYRKIMHLVPLLLFWLMITSFFWSWIFTFLTDAPREEKIVFFIECDVPGAKEIASALEENPSDGIRLVQVRPFSYSMMSSDSIRASDLYIISESGMTEYRQWLLPIPENAVREEEIFVLDGVPLGYKVYDKETGEGLLKNHIAYEKDGQEKQNYYLAFGNQSLHILENDGAIDDLAVLYASRLFEIQQ